VLGADEHDADIAGGRGPPAIHRPPQYVTRAREIATRMTKPAASVTNAADVLEDLARLQRVG
jgi:hypothetical protein